MVITWQGSDIFFKLITNRLDMIIGNTQSCVITKILCSFGFVCLGQGSRNWPLSFWTTNRQNILGICF